EEEVPVEEQVAEVPEGTTEENVEYEYVEEEVPVEEQVAEVPEGTTEENVEYEYVEEEVPVEEQVAEAPEGTTEENVEYEYVEEEVPVEEQVAEALEGTTEENVEYEYVEEEVPVEEQVAEVPEGTTEENVEYEYAEEEVPVEEQVAENTEEDIKNQKLVSKDNEKEKIVVDLEQVKDEIKLAVENPIILPNMLYFGGEYKSVLASKVAIQSHPVMLTEFKKVKKKRRKYKTPKNRVVLNVKKNNDDAYLPKSKR
ncbi:MAG: hypothetical protein MJ247_02335, partial [Alphaproteobacteria bacterium]|nr:hypothetical protein [Alphaproteobacteria bacterium]